MCNRIALGLGLALAAATLIASRPAGAKCLRDIHLVAGVEDDFALPAEPTQPAADLVAYTQKWWPLPATRQFDTEATDLALIHTFTGWQGPICGATLELHLHGGPSTLSSNDSIRLELLGGSDHQKAFLYWVTIHYVLGDWGPGQAGVVTLDLADLPVYGGFPTDILISLNDGRMDLMVEDDTAVDYAKLDICGCRHLELVPLDHLTWGRLKSLYLPDGQ